MTKTPRRKFTSLLAIVVLCLGVAACNGSDDGAQTDVAEDEEPIADATAQADDEPGADDTADPGGGADEAEADDTEAPGELVEMRVSTLTFPSLVPVIPAIIDAQGFDESNGIDLQIEPFADIGAFYAAATTGQVDATVAGPTVLSNLVAEGADLQVIATFASLAPLLVITADPEIESLEDLEGRSLAATVASAEYQALAIYGRSLGLDLETDLTLVNGSPADVRTQLQAGRVDAGMLWEPGASLALADNEDYRIILNGADAWEELTGERGWELIWGMNGSFIEENPQVPEAWIAANNEAVEWLFANREEAAAIMEEATGMPTDAFLDVLDQGRVDYQILPAWEADVRSSIQTHFDLAVEYGFQESLPDDSIFFEPAG